ncbi:MAG: DNA-3-methyladenine glycosylase 2 family protein [Alphaproteobacteria bacterium]|nr:DNA-3-methyladenine glycosylase 2 family protein [Alphaproteobacteria bacterium]
MSLTGRALAQSLRALAERDKDLARAIDLVGPLPDRTRQPGFPALLRIVCEQQLSVASAAAIWRRLEAEFSPLTPENLLAADDARLAALGLSRPKIRYGRCLAEAVREGRLDFERLHGLDDRAASEELCAVKGIGRWTAEIYLLFVMRRPDIWPAGDLALQEGMRLLKRLRKRPDEARMDRLARPWAPHRGTAARILWRYYALTKKGAQAPEGA